MTQYLSMTDELFKDKTHKAILALKKKKKVK